MSSPRKSDARLEFRLPSKWKAQIERAALMQNRSLTDFATAVLTEAARKVLDEDAQESRVQLSNRDRDRFLAMLSADPTPNRALQAAAKRHRRRIP